MVKLHVHIWFVLVLTIYLGPDKALGDTCVEEDGSICQDLPVGENAHSEPIALPEGACGQEDLLACNQVVHDLVLQCAAGDKAACERSVNLFDKDLASVAPLADASGIVIKTSALRPMADLKGYVNAARTAVTHIAFEDATGNVVPFRVRVAKDSPPPPFTFLLEVTDLGLQLYEVTDNSKLGNNHFLSCERPGCPQLEDYRLNEVPTWLEPLAGPDHPGELILVVSPTTRIEAVLAVANVLSESRASLWLPEMTVKSAGERHLRPVLAKPTGKAKWKAQGNVVRGVGSLVDDCQRKTQDDTEQALALCAEAMKQQPGCGACLMATAEVYAHLDNERAQLSTLHHAQKMHPRNTSVLLELGFQYMVMGDLNRAQRLIKHALSLDRKSPYARALWKNIKSAMQSAPPPEGPSFSQEDGLLLMRSRLLTRALPNLRACYSQSITQQPDLGGRLRVRVWLNGKGKVTSAYRSPDSPPLGGSNGEALEACLFDVIREFDFAMLDENASNLRWARLDLAMWLVPPTFLQ